MLDLAKPLLQDGAHEAGELFRIIALILHDEAKLVFIIWLEDALAAEKLLVG